MKKRMFKALLVFLSVVVCAVCLAACNSGGSHPIEYVGQYEFVSTKMTMTLNGETSENLIETGDYGIDGNFIVIDLKETGSYNVVFSERYMALVGATGNGSSELKGEWSVYSGKISLKGSDYQNGVLEGTLLTFVISTNMSYSGDTASSRVEYKFNKVAGSGIGGSGNEIVVPEFPTVGGAVQVDEEGWNSAVENTWTANNVTTAIRVKRTLNGKTVEAVIFGRITEDKMYIDLYGIENGKKKRAEFYWTAVAPYNKICLEKFDSDEWFGLTTSNNDLKLNSFATCGRLLWDITDRYLFDNILFGRLNYFYWIWSNLFSDFNYNDGVYELTDTNQSSGEQFTRAVKIEENGLLSYIKIDYSSETEELGSFSETVEYVFYDFGTTEISEPEDATIYLRDIRYNLGRL